MVKIASRFASQIRNFSKQKQTIWGYFTGTAKKEKPPPETCKKQKPPEGDPDLSRFGGKAYRTCGSAYIIQKDTIPAAVSSQTDEDKILRKIEADLSVKDSVEDPMPPFQSVEQRLIDLSERKLHPFYKKFMSIPKKDFVEGDKRVPFLYKCMTEPIKVEDIPESFRISKELLEKKNIFADFKQVQLPKQMVVRALEVEKNRKPTLEKKKK